MLQPGKVQHIFFTVTNVQTTYDWEIPWVDSLPILNQLYADDYSKDLYNFDEGSNISIYESPDPSDEWANYQGLYMVSLGQHPQIKSVTYQKVYLTDVIAKIGGIGVTLLGLLSICLSGHTQFSYDISRLKRFFYFEKISKERDRALSRDLLDQKPDGEVKRKLKDLITQREIISMKYIFYILIYAFNSTCCCMTSRCREGRYK